MVEKTAPVQGYSQGIPWSLHLEAYDAYCKRHSPQPALIDLEGRGCRGGFGTRELDDFIPGWRERAGEIGRLRAENTALRKDAERYRWLRDKARTSHAVSVIQCMPGEMDFAVDTAMVAD